MRAFSGDSGRFGLVFPSLIFAHWGCGLSTEAPARLGKGGIDIVLLDGALADPDRDATIKAARALKPPPFVALCGDAGAVAPGGVDATLPKPGSLEESQALIERCVRTRLPINVLIADDSATMRSIIRKILSASRYTLETAEAAEGLAALKDLSSGKFSLVMLDYNMPGFNGFETLSEIKRVAPDIAVVMMTSTVDEAVATRARAAGAMAFLKKPFYPSDIDSVLDRYFATAAR